MRTLIVGHGIVGTNLGRELAALEPEFCDKRLGERAEGHFDIAFVCVDTPLVDGTLDATEVWNAVRENDADVYVVKSTVVPGTTDSIASETGKRVVFSPEYYGATQHNDCDFDFTILGGDKRDCVVVQQALQHVYDGRHRFAITDSMTAELAKLMENCWLATKVSFCNQFFDLAERYGLCYEELRELFLLDPRVSPSHTFCYRDSPWWSSHCLDKDVSAIAKEAPLIQAVVDFNESRK